MAYDTQAEKPDTIKIPATLTDDSTCYLTEPIKFLNAKTVKCLKSVNQLCAYNNKLLMQLFNSQLFHRPSKMTETREASDVISINIQSCKHSFVNCTRLSMSDGDGAEETELLGDELFDEILMEFLINDTSIVSANVTLLVNEEFVCGVEEFGPMRVIQRVEVRFKSLNENQARSIRKRSRGYHTEELILATRLRPVNETAPDSMLVFDYFRNDTLPDADFSMKIPESRRGKCVLNRHLNDLIRFNENSQTRCNVELKRDEKANETLCQQFQRQIIHFLFSTMNLTANYTQENFASDVFVSKFWSPRYDVISWTRVDVVNAPAWSPEMREADKSFTCLALATSIKYSFFSSKVRVARSRKYENVIESVQVEFGRIEELTFAIDDENQTASVKIQLQVHFFNSHEKSGAEKIYIYLQFIVISSLLVLNIL